MNEFELIEKIKQLEKEISNHTYDIRCYKFFDVDNDDIEKEDLEISLQYCKDILKERYNK